MSELIERLSKASDRHGYPWLIGFMDLYGYMSLQEAYRDPLGEDNARRYIQASGLGTAREN